jgi:tetratricopeptide (TPR) repeat protein
MPATIDHFTRSEVLRMVGITPSQLGYWERLQLIQPHTIAHRKVYTFGDLVSLRAVKELKDQRVPAGQLRQALRALRQQLNQVEMPLTQLRIRSRGHRIVVEYQGVTIEPLSGQLLINFETSAPDEKVSAMPEPSHSDTRLEDGFTLALEYEGCPELRLQAIEAYRRVIQKFPGSVEARLNLGTLLYEQGDRNEAAEHFRCAVALAPDNPLAHFDLGTVLEDLGELQAAAQHLGEALRLKPDYADAHYNLARVYEKLNAFLEARHHWRRYLQLDPNSQWAQYARQRLGSETP